MIAPVFGVRRQAAGRKDGKTPMNERVMRFHALRTIVQRFCRQTDDLREFCDD